MSEVTHHGRSTDLHHLAAGGPQHRLATDHPRTVRKHDDADERETVVVPGHCRDIRTVGTLGEFNALIFAVGGDVDVADLPVEAGD